MASLQRSSRVVWIPLSFAIYTSSCFSAGRKEQCPRTCVTLTSSHSTRPKDKGHRSDCNTHRGISLLSITGKAFARVGLNRLQKVAKRVYPEAQCGFKAGRSTIDMIFFLRQLQEKCREQSRGNPCILPLSTRVRPSNLISRKGLFTLLQRMGCPPKLLRKIMSFHEDMQETVQ